MMHISHKKFYAIIAGSMVAAGAVALGISSIASAGNSDNGYAECKDAIWTSAPLPLAQN